MARKAMSVTLDEANVLWLRGQARMSPGNNVSETLDRLITRVRLGRTLPGGRPPSVVGTVDLLDDPLLLKADEAVRAWFAESLSRSSMELNEDAPGMTTGGKKKRKRRRG
jgi:hypothetical protein